MIADNPTWGSPRIHGELKMLGFDISERTTNPVPPAICDWGRLSIDQLSLIICVTVLQTRV
jgi:hypothetical protein